MGGGREESLTFSGEFDYFLLVFALKNREKVGRKSKKVEESRAHSVGSREKVGKS